ncbi:MAG: hypothetical protein [Microvirus sp.]|nr:MAG: hypothetical protein [Microvirus sp.]
MFGLRPRIVNLPSITRRRPLPRFARRAYLFNSDLDRNQLRRKYRTLTVSTSLPLSVALRARKEVYTYPKPNQKRKRARVIRHALLLAPAAGRRNQTKNKLGRIILPNDPFVETKVKILVPNRLPKAEPSYVSVRRGKLNIHSVNQLDRALRAEELNRRRYQENKGNHRKARHGQLDSPGSLAYGLVAYAAKKNLSIKRIADAALVARSILKGGV